VVVPLTADRRASTTNQQVENCNSSAIGRESRRACEANNTEDLSRARILDGGNNARRRIFIELPITLTVIGRISAPLGPHLQLLKPLGDITQWMALLLIMITVPAIASGLAPLQAIYI
jgi:hypothetical protein